MVRLTRFTRSVLLCQNLQPFDKARHFFWNVSTLPSLACSCLDVFIYFWYKLTNTICVTNFPWTVSSYEQDWNPVCFSSARQMRECIQQCVMIAWRRSRHPLSLLMNPMARTYQMYPTRDRSWNHLLMKRLFPGIQELLTESVCQFLTFGIYFTEKAGAWCCKQVRMNLISHTAVKRFVPRWWYT